MVIQRYLSKLSVAIDEINGIEILQTTLSVEKNIFLATNVGLFLGKISTNLKDPNNWKRGFCCFDDGPINSMTRYQDGLAFIFDEDDNDPAKVFIYIPMKNLIYMRILIFPFLLSLKR